MTTLKKISYIFLYIISFIGIGASVFYLSENNLCPALISSFLTMAIYTILIIKNIKILSTLAFFTVLPVFLLALGASGNQDLLQERSFMIMMSLHSAFIIINSIIWIKNKDGFKKVISFILISLIVFLLIVFGTASPAYYQNFVYTRIDILIILILGIFLIVQKKIIWGVLGILLSIGILLLSTGLFAGKTYVIEGGEKEEIVALVDPLVEEMFGYYNQKDFNNFCKHCTDSLINMMSKGSLEEIRESWGVCTIGDDRPEIYRKAGSFYITYTADFENTEEAERIIIIIENISQDLKFNGIQIGE